MISSIPWARPRALEDPQNPMLVCHCNGVSDRTIRRSVRSGARTLSQVGQACGAGTCCNGCVPAISAIIHTESSTAERETTDPVVLPLARSLA